jgi:hypothetical protein
MFDTSPIGTVLEPMPDTSGGNRSGPTLQEKFLWLAK